MWQPAMRVRSSRIQYLGVRTERWLSCSQSRSGVSFTPVLRQVIM